MDSVKDVLRLTADYATQYLDSLDERPVGSRPRSRNCAPASAARCPSEGAPPSR